ncbi:MAG: NAD-dependent epimerase/dehydratase family protein [Actinomycetota bacterium]|nr:NAD-dependent epimerase/dehydratase family protein [Actinomycetota bacterium]
MRIVVVGATGNVGTSVVEALGRDARVDSIVGVARRIPELDAPKTSWASADIGVDELTPLFRKADCVIHLAWLIQPSRDPDTLRRTNLEGSRRVFQAVAEARVPALVYASSIGAYSPGPKDDPVDETWPTDGIATSFYSRHKAQTERMLDHFELDHPEIRVVRLRPALIFKREAATGVRRLFIGPLLPNALVQKKLIPAIPDLERLVFQAVHSEDVAEAYRLAATTDVRGPFNIAADPVLDPPTLSALLGAPLVSLPEGALRVGAWASWRLRLQPSPEGWVDMALQTPIMDPTRANKELGWSPRFTADYALLELLQGIRDGAGFPTPPLAPSTSGPLRIRELLTGIGARTGLR